MFRLAKNAPTVDTAILRFTLFSGYVEASLFRRWLVAHDGPGIDLLGLGRHALDGSLVGLFVHLVAVLEPRRRRPDAAALTLVGDAVQRGVSPACHKGDRCGGCEKALHSITPSSLGSRVSAIVGRRRSWGRDLLGAPLIAGDRDLSRRYGSLSGFGQSDRQRNREPRALILSAFDPDGSAMQIDQHLDQIKSEAGADDSGNIAAAVVALEQTIEVCPRNADAAVRNRDGDAIELDGGRDPDEAAAGRVFDGVGEEIAEHLVEQFWVGHQRQRPRLEILEYLHVGRDFPMQQADLVQERDGVD